MYSQNTVAMLFQSNMMEQTNAITNMKMKYKGEKLEEVITPAIRVAKESTASQLEVQSRRKV